MLNKFFITIIAILFTANVFSQQVFVMGEGDLFQEQETAEYGTVQVFQDARIQSLINIDVEINEATPKMQGWRIQIYFGSGTNASAKANRLKAEFMNAHSLHSAYLEYNAPFFKVRVGDFRSFLDALRVLKEIENNYNNCWIVEDEINYPKL